jgi:hypothetical protein
MTNIPHVNIWMEAEAFFDSITDADRTLRIVAGDGGGRVRREAPPTLHVSRSIGRQHIKVPAIRSSSRAWSRDRMTRFTPRLLIARETLVQSARAVRLRRPPEERFRRPA